MLDAVRGLGFRGLRAQLPLGIGLALASLQVGWWPLGVFVAVWAVVQLAYRRTTVAPRPEIWLVSALGVAQVSTGVTIALTGGPNSPLMVWLLPPVVALALRFDERVVTAGVAATLAVLTAATVGVDPSGLVNAPALTAMIAGALVSVVAIASAIMRAEINHRSDAMIDALTGLLNRKALRRRFAQVAHDARMADEPVALVLCDIDHFKAVNDEFGHARGDEVLREVAAAMRTGLRRLDVYRIGGEEFLIVLPGIEPAAAIKIAQRVRSAVARQTGVTVSVGVGVAPGREVSWERLYRDTDRALYEAKFAGRNRVVLAEDLTASAVA